MCFGCLKEPSHGDGSFDYPKHMFWLRNKKTNFQFRTLIWGPFLDKYGKFDFRLIMHSDCLEELDLEDNLIGDSAGRELLEALEHRKEGMSYWT